MSEKVRIRFLGANWRKGIPLQRHINIGGQKLWNYRRFPEQLEDASYIRDIDFYMQNQKVLDDQKIFIVEFMEEGNAEYVETDDAGNDVPKEIPENIKGRECPHCHKMITCQNEAYFDRYFNSHKSQCFKRQQSNSEQEGE